MRRFKHRLGRSAGCEQGIRFSPADRRLFPPRAAPFGRADPESVAAAVAHTKITGGWQGLQGPRIRFRGSRRAAGNPINLSVDVHAVVSAELSRFDKAHRGADLAALVRRSSCTVWHDDWASWGVDRQSDGQLVLQGTTTVAHLRGQTYAAARHILESLGPRRVPTSMDRTRLSRRGVHSVAGRRLVMRAAGSVVAGGAHTSTCEETTARRPSTFWMGRRVPRSLATHQMDTYKNRLNCLNRRDDVQGGKVRSVASRITGEQRHATNDRVRAHIEIRHWRTFGSTSLPVREEGLSGEEPGLIG